LGLGDREDRSPRRVYIAGAFEKISVTPLNSIRDPWLDHFDTHKKKVEFDPISLSGVRLDFPLK
jgi:hypothetical protein